MPSLVRGSKSNGVSSSRKRGDECVDPRPLTVVDQYVRPMAAQRGD